MHTSTARSAAPPREALLAGIIFALATVAVAAVGSLVNRGAEDWYDGLEKPAYQPPDATFGIVWTILYVLIAVAGWLAWRATDSPRPTTWWAIQMALNLGWTAVFFGLESPAGGLVVVAALIVAVAIDLRESWRVSTVAGALLVPYLLWCCFAAALNVGVLVLN